MTSSLERRVTKLEAGSGLSGARLPSVFLRYVQEVGEPEEVAEAARAAMVAEEIAAGRAQSKEDVFFITYRVVDPVAYRREIGLPPLISTS